MEKYIEKVKTLHESLPYIRQFHNKTIVIKYGGNAMVDEELKRGFAKDIILMKYVGLNPVVVHGGGPQIGDILEKIGKKSRFVNGVRVTDNETMDIVEMVLTGKVNKEIVGFINHYGGKAVGLSGKDGDLIKARKLSPVAVQSDGELPPEIIDLGKAASVERINPAIIKTLDDDGFIPVIAPVGVGKDGTSYNINADTVAGALASSIKAEKLILLTDTVGVLDKNETLIPTINTTEAGELIENGTISGGMIPKVKCCLNSLSNGVSKTHVIDGRIEHAVLLEIFTDAGIGTEILNK